MKIPRTVRVCATVYEVRRVPATQVGEGGDQGECKSDEGLILIAEHLPDRVALPVLHNELGHATWFESGAYQYMKRYLPAHALHEVEEDLCNIWLPDYRAAIGVK